MVSALQGEHERSVRFYGATEALRDTLGSSIEPHDRADYELGLAAARGGLVKPAFSAAWAEGRAVSPNETLANALAEDAPR